MVWHRLIESDGTEGGMTSVVPGEAEWRVLRHSGRGGAPASEGWREVSRGDEQTARGLYHAIRATMRQGGLRLVDARDAVEKEYHAPLLRTRW